MALLSLKVVLFRIQFFLNILENHHENYGKGPESFTKYSVRAMVIPCAIDEEAISYRFLALEHDSVEVCCNFFILKYPYFLGNINGWRKI
jgi:hypothetical protein